MSGIGRSYRGANLPATGPVRVVPPPGVEALLSRPFLCYEGRMKTWKSLAMASIAVALVGSLSMSGCKRLTGGGATPSTEDEKTLYTLGMLLGRNLGTF